MIRYWPDGSVTRAAAVPLDVQRVTVPSLTGEDLQCLLTYVPPCVTPGCPTGKVILIMPPFQWYEEEDDDDGDALQLR